MINKEEIKIDRRENILSQELMRLSIRKLSLELSRDKSEGSYYHSWQSNIAIAFIDEFNIQKDMVELTGSIYNFEELNFYEIANNAAKRFLDQLIGE
jgi:hypothetical protein